MKYLLGFSILLACNGCTPLPTDSAEQPRVAIVPERPIVDVVVQAVETGSSVESIVGMPPLDDETISILEQLAGCKGTLEQEPTAKQVIVRFPCKPPILESEKSELVGVVLIFDFEAEMLSDFNAYAVRVQTVTVQN